MSHVVFSEMGFGDIFSVPMANAENQALENELRKKQKAILHLENKISQHKETSQALLDFMKNLRQELSHTQALSKAVVKEIECEIHFKALADREMGCLQQETERLEKDLLLQSDKKNKLEASIIEGSEKQERMKNHLDWDQQTLDAWLDKSAQEDEDTMVLLKYCGQDEARIQDLMLSIDRATLELNQKNKALNAEWTKTMTAQVELDRVEENFHRAHVERQELIHQWENTLEQMRKRDCDLEQCLMSLPLGNQEVRKRQEMIAEKKSQLESQERINQECGRKGEVAKQQAAKQRTHFQENERQCAQLKSEVESLKATAEQVATKVEAMRSQRTSLQHDNKEKSYRMKNTRLNNAALEQKLKGLRELTVGVEGVASKVERMLEEEELANGELQSAIHHHHRLLSQKAQEFQDLKSKEDNLAAMTSSTQDILRSLHIHFNKVEQEFIKGNELIHIKDHQLKLVKGKLSLLTGEPSPEEDDALRRELAELSKTMEEKARTTLLLSQQLRTLTVENLSVKKAMKKLKMQRRDVSSKMVEIELSNEMSQKELKKLIHKNQQKLVEENLLKLEAKRVRDRLQNEAESVLSLQKKRMHLKASTKEKGLEIDYNRDVLQTKVRIGNQENQSLRMEMNENLSRIDKMKTRYETIVVPTMDPDGGERSLEYYMIQVAQEREELKRKGDELDGKVRNKETEIEALENTLHAISRRTEHQKVSGLLSHSTEEYRLHLQLEEQKRDMDEKHSFKMRQIRELQQDIEGMNNTLGNLHQEEATEMAQMDENRIEIMTLNKELEAQKEKLERVTKQCSKLTGVIRLCKKVKGMTKEEHDIDLCQLKDFDKMVDRMLLEAMAEKPDLRPVLQAHFQEKSLSLPEPIFPAAICLSLGPRSAICARSSYSSSIRAESPPPQASKPSSGPCSSPIRSVRSSGSNRYRPESPVPRVFKPASRLSSARSSVSSVRSVRSSGSNRLRPESPVLRVFKPASRLSSPRSSVSSVSGSPRTPGQRSPCVKTVDLGLQLTVTSALSPRSTRQRPLDTRGSTSSRKSRGKTP